MDAKTNKAKKTETKDEQIKRLEEQIKLLEHHLERRSERYLKDQQTISKLNRMLEQGLKELEDVYGLVTTMIVVEHGREDINGNGEKTLYVPYLKPEELKKYKFSVKTEKDAQGKTTGMKLSVKSVTSEIATDEVENETLKLYTEKE